MGLDTAELVMEIEDAFSIAIPDEEAGRMVTVGDVYDYIIAKTSVPTNSSVCLSAVAFYSLRRAVMTLGAPRRLRPRDSLSAILPDSNRPEYWSELQRTSELTLPPLQRPGSLVTICMMVVMICSIILGIATYLSTNSPLGGAMSALAAVLLLGLLFGRLTRPYAVVPPSNCATLRGLTESALRLNFATLSERRNAASKNDIWIALRSMIVNHLGVAPEDVKPTTSFVKDLGA